MILSEAILPQGAMIVIIRSFQWHAMEHGRSTFPTPIAMRSPNTLLLSLCAMAAHAQLTPICQLQGTGAATPFANQLVTTTGIVTAIHLGTGTLQGYFIEEPTCDADPLTSNGIFVYQPSASGISIGSRVQVTGTIVEYQGLTELTTVQSLSVLGTGTVPPTDLTLPITSNTFYERYEGMLLHFPQTLVVNDQSDWVQYGELTLAPQRLLTPTDTIDPNDVLASGTSSSGAGNVAAVNALDDLNTRSAILLDDGRTSSYAVPPALIGPEGTLRSGSTITGLTAVLSYSYSAFRLQPAGLIPIMHAVRPAVPAVGGQLRVAGLNLLNYWTTLGGWGAANSTEFDRQRTKLVAALMALDADVLALNELENNAVAYVDLLTALNAAVSDPYTALDDGSTGGATKSVLFYRASAVTPCTPLYSISTSVFQRHHLTQGFTVNATGGRFLVSTLHLRSKLCGGGGASDQDQGDGQGCYNGNRKDQALALLDHWSTVRGVTGITAQLALGDMNSYTEEDPVDILRTGGFADLLPHTDHSYLYGGTFGALDHAMGTPDLVAALSDAATWSINSDEPAGLSYTDVNLPLYQPGPYRCSDHDPVLVGLNDAALPVSVAETTHTPGVLLAQGNGVLSWSLLPPPATGDPIELLSADGRLVKRVIIQGDRVVMDVSGLGAGLYIWRLAGMPGAEGRVVLP